MQVLDQFDNPVTSDNSDQVILTVASGPGTFAGLASLTDADWQQIKEKSLAATAASKAQRSV